MTFLSLPNETNLDHRGDWKLLTKILKMEDTSIGRIYSVYRLNKWDLRITWKIKRMLRLTDTNNLQEVKVMRTPKHIGIIPDGNRRWAETNKMTKEKGYEYGIDPGLMLFKLCKEAGIKELTYYGFTTDNTKRPTEQRIAFTNACVNAVNVLSKEEAELLVIGDFESPMFPEELQKYTTRQIFGNGGIKVNFLVNYGWEWDLNNLKSADSTHKNITSNIKSFDITRIDLIIRWGGRRRLSGFLPVQSIYSDFYVLDDYWPDFNPGHFYNALNWYNDQDVTLGG